MAEGYYIHKNRISGNRSAQNPSPSDNETDPGVSMESLQTSMNRDHQGPAYEGGKVTTEES
jgi:hypothetical protein